MKIHCDCGKIHEVRKDKEAPKNAISMGCNYCPACEAKDYYDEWHNYPDPDAKPKISIGKNQLKLDL